MEHIGKKKIKANIDRFGAVRTYNKHQFARRRPKSKNSYAHRINKNRARALVYGGDNVMYL